MVVSHDFSSLLEDDLDQLLDRCQRPRRTFAGRPVILLGRDSQSKLKEFISPINRLDRRGPSYSFNSQARQPFFRIMDRSSIFSEHRSYERPANTTNRKRDRSRMTCLKCCPVLKLLSPRSAGQRYFGLQSSPRRIRIANPVQRFPQVEIAAIYKSAPARGRLESCPAQLPMNGQSQLRLHRASNARACPR
jgi:hypothetical protein